MILRKMVTEKETNEERILKFLELTRDPNPKHRGEERIFPGMFYLALVIPYLNKPIEYFELKFKNFIKYPCSIDLLVEETDNGNRKITFVEGKETLCEGEFKFKEQAETKNQGLEEFAEIVRSDLNNVNLRRIWLACLIPGRLIDLLKGEGIYRRQKMNFKGDYLEGVNLRLEVAREKRGGNVKRVDTIYEDISHNIVAEGFANVAVA